MTLPSASQFEGTPKEAADILGKSVSYIYNLIAAGVIPARTMKMPPRFRKASTQRDSIGRRKAQKKRVDMVCVYCMAFGEEAVIEELREAGRTEREIEILLAGYRRDN